MITAAGALDECRPVRRLLRPDSFAVVTGEKAFIRGWLAPPPQSRPIRKMRLHLGTAVYEVPYGFVRSDVADVLKMREARLGFEGHVNVSFEHVYTAELAISGLLADGTPVTTSQATSLNCYVASSASPAPSPDMVQTGALSRIRTIADTPPAAPLHGRSRRSVRDDAAVEVRGWIVDRSRRAAGERIALLLRKDGRLIASFPAQRTFDGEASALTGQTIDAGFRARIITADLAPGLYSIAPAVLDAGAWFAGSEEYFERCVPYDPAPKFLPVFRRPAEGTVAFLDAGPIQRGKPLAVRGWAKDPVSGDAGRGVYARLDDNHFLPLPSNLDQPDGEWPARAPGFSGIVDTTILLPGSHEVEIAVFSKSGSGWYALGSKQVEITA